MQGERCVPQIEASQNGQRELSERGRFPTAAHRLADDGGVLVDLHEGVVDAAVERDPAPIADGVEAGLEVAALIAERQRGVVVSGRCQHGTKFNRRPRPMEPTGWKPTRQPGVSLPASEASRCQALEPGIP